MHNARTLLLVTSMLVGGSLAAPAASAIEEVDVVKENGGALCTFATCPIHVTGEVELSSIIFGFEVHEGDCPIELDMELDGDGNRQVVSFNELEDTAGTHDANCFHGPVTAAESLPWIGRGEEDAPGVVGVTTNIDFDPTESGECTGAVSLEMVETAGETYEAVFSNARVGSSICEISGRLAYGEAPAFHVNHP